MPGEKQTNLALRCEVLGRDKTALLGDALNPVPEGVEGYDAALTAAGVAVVASQSFGSYQGDWWAQVRFTNGEEYFVTGSFGSCSYCDAFEAEFDYGASEQPDYLHRLAAFGRNYLECCYTLEQAIAKASENLSWDCDAEEMVEWLRSRDSGRRALAEAARDE